MIHFAQPLWILTGLTLCLGVIFFWRRMEAQRQVQMERFAAAHLLSRLTRSISPRRRLLKKSLLLLALFCCFLALARPQYGFKWVEVKRKGIDILLALDTSRSMLTVDIRPNRLERSKLAIIDFVNQLEGDRVGLLPFAGSAFLMCPLTMDYNAFAASLASVTTDIIPRGGTDLAKAITLAESSLLDNANHKILILLTDGENLEGDALAAATKAAKNGMTIFTVGVGTTKGELIPVSPLEPGRFIKDESGKFVTSRLDEAALTAIAEAAGGLYVPLGKNGEGLERIYQQKLSLIPKKELTEKKHKEPVERFTWPLGTAILLLMMEFIISGRKSERSFRLPFIKTAGRRKPHPGTVAQSPAKEMYRKAGALFLLITLSAVNYSDASTGEKAFADGDFITASKFYTKALKEKPDDPSLHYNAGTAAYKNNLFDDAISSFQQALKSADLGLQEKSYYNLGNALFKKGEELSQSDPEQAGKLWQQAVDAYGGSLQLNPQERESKENQELVQKKLEELKQEQQEKKDQQKQDQQKQKKEQTSDQQEQKDKEGQSEKQDEQGQPKSQDPSATANDSSPTPENPGDQSDDSKESEADKGAEQEQRPEQAEADKSAEARSGEDQQQKEAAASQAAQQGQAGKMTSEEARQLLRRLKDEEGKLNFVPQAEKGEAGKERSWKDW